MKERILRSKFTWIITAIVILVTAGILVLRSFDSIKPKTTSEVKSFLVDSGYCDSSEIQGANGAGMHTLAGTAFDRNINMIVFYQYDKGEKGARETLDLCYNSFCDSELITSERKGANYVISEIDRSDKNYVLTVKADNTMLNISGPYVGKDAVRKLASELGYFKE